MEWSVHLRGEWFVERVIPRNERGVWTQAEIVFFFLFPEKQQS